MCGIAGIIGGNKDKSISLIEDMKNTIRHRGPDGEGTYIDSEFPIVLGHRRLSILDPGHGQQPMTTEDHRFTVVFNGCIYNYLELRRLLISHGHKITSYSDTEVILYAYKEWGSDCVNRFEGMFAFAVWDRHKKQLFIARDRIGIKPLYYHFDGKRFVFASEVKALLKCGIQAESNNDALKDYLTFQFCLGDKTLFKNISKLEPGHYIELDFNTESLQISKTQYWDLAFDIDEAHDEQWFIDHLSGLIEDSIRMHLRSDVTLGAHLSGGLDSSTVVCQASSLLEPERIKTFTGAFSEGPQYDETQYAKAVSSFANTEYQDVYIQGVDLSKILPIIMYYMDEPMAGPGVIPQYYVSKLASEHVKVVLGGQGGDELFIGYARYLVAYLEQCLSGAIYETSHKDKYAVTLDSIVPNLPLLKTYKPMLQGLWSDGLFDSSDKRYFKLIDRSGGMASLFNEGALTSDYSPFEAFQEVFNRANINSLVNQMSYFDLKGSLPALLHVEDRTSMAASIESRVPLLDHRLIEFMAKIPPNIKFAQGRMKHLFKESVRNSVPGEIFNRKDKMGFPTPIVEWMRGTSKDFVYDILLSKNVRERGIYNNKKIEDLIRGEGQYGRALWGMLCLELWHRIFIDGDYHIDA